MGHSRFSSQRPLEFPKSASLPKCPAGLVFVKTPGTHFTRQAYILLVTMGELVDETMRASSVQVYAMKQEESKTGD